MFNHVGLRSIPCKIKKLYKPDKQNAAKTAGSNHFYAYEHSSTADVKSMDSNRLLNHMP